MYKVLCDGTLMCDSRIEELALINPVVKLEENKAGSFSFIITPEHPMYDSVQKRKSLIEVYQDDELEPLFCGVCIEETKDFYKQKKIYCEGEFSFFNDSIQRPACYQNISVRGLLEAYIDNHNSQVEESKRFTVGQVTVADQNDSLYCFTNMESTMKCLKEDLVDDLGGFFRIRHVDGVRYLDYLAESPNTNSQGIKIGKNLMDFTTNVNSSEIATAIIPLGCKLEESSVEGLDVRLTIESVNDGKDYVFSQDAVNNYGWIYKTVEWDDVTTPEALKSKGEKYLSDIQFENMVIEAKAVDLHLTDVEIERFKVSDQIRVVSTPHGLNKYFKLSKLTVDLNNPEKNSITLGKDERLTLSAKSNQTNAEIKKAIESIVPASTILEKAVENATQLIKNSMNGYITTVLNEDGSPKELLIMDTPNKETATKVWRWNINGLGYSSTGYDGDYALAMTMDGTIVADFIKAGVLTGIEINNGSAMFRVDSKGNVVANSFSSNNAIITGGNIRYSATEGVFEITGSGISGITNRAEGGGYYTISVDLKNTDGTDATYLTPGMITTKHGGSDAYTFFATSGILINRTPSLFYGDMDIVEGRLWVRQDLTVSGSKSRVATTENFKDRLLYCYEMPTPFFGDIGEAQLDENGICYIYIDDVFIETIDTECMYQVFVQKYDEGECIIAERNRNHFIVKGTPNLKFAWEIKAKQEGYTMERLEEHKQEEKETEINYEAEAFAYLSNYERQVLNYE